MPKITNDKILFFDMDGTLIDTDYANLLSYEKAIRSVTNSDFKLAYNPDERFNRNNLKNIIPNLSESEYNRIVQMKEEYYKDFLHETKPINQIVELLWKYSKTNQTVLVTNSREDRARITLNYHKLTDKFNHLFFKQVENSNGKANKFLNAVTALNILPHLIIAYENEEIEIINAKQAGIEIINPIQ